MNLIPDLVKLSFVLKFVLTFIDCLDEGTFSLKLSQTQTTDGNNLSSRLIDHHGNHEDVTSFPRHQLESSQVCGGVFKSHQMILMSPNYPNIYPPGLRCVYIIKSPFLCRSEFHVQFLDFRLESSKDCTRDTLTINETDRLCGQVIGIKRYSTSNGVLRIEFRTDDSVEANGFKLLITRLPCQEFNGAKELERTEQMINDKKKTLGGTIEPAFDILPPHKPQYQKTSKQYLPPVGYLPSIPSYPPPKTNNEYLPPQQFCSPNIFTPSIATNILPLPTGTMPPLPNHFLNSTFYPTPTPKVEPQITAWLSSTIPPCCAKSFNQKRFYLSSPEFPRTSYDPRDCLYYIEKFGPGVCRLRIEFKFFFMGNDPQRCQDDFIEIDTQRICGCRTGLVYTSQWGVGAKVIRFRASGRRYSHNSGFILDVIQEDCPYRYSQSLEDNSAAQKRLDTSNIYKTIVETNSTTRTSYYFTSDHDQVPQKQIQKFQEGPSSQFFFLGSNLKSPCVFFLADYIRLSWESLWIQKPDCIAV